MASNTSPSAVENGYNLPQNGYANGHADGHANGYANGHGNGMPLGEKASTEKRIIEHISADAGYDQDRPSAIKGEYSEDDNPYIHHKMSFRLFMSLTAMSFLWIGSQIPLFLLGGVIPLIYNDVGDYDIWLWLVLGYLIPNSALCPFVGALSDLIGRKLVAAIGQILLIIGPIITVTSHSMHIAIAGMVISGAGAGLNELIALAGTAELVPVKKRGFYVGMVVFTILPFCPSVLWAQLIAQASSWRYVGILICVWNFLGLIFVVFTYDDPAKHKKIDKKKVLREIDYVGGILSTFGVTTFMMGLQWGATQYEWSSVHVLAPFLIGLVIIIAFFVWEMKFAPYPMVPAAIFSRAKRTMIAILLITFFSGGNFFVLLLFYPTQIFNQFGDDPLGVGLRSLPIGFGIILGAIVGLISIPILKGRTTVLMIVSTGLMTMGTGLMSLARTDNLPTVYGLITVASFFVGMVIIPCSIIAQIVCPPELIGTITAVTLSIRYIGGAIGFTAYYNIFYPKLVGYITDQSSLVVLNARISFDKDTIVNMLTLAAQAMYPALKQLIATSPKIVFNRANAYNIIIGTVQQSFAQAYRWPYWMSIAFGGVCFICSFFLQDIKDFL